MTRYTLPYKKSNPRTVRGARRRGWHVVDVPDDAFKKINQSFLGLMMEADRQCKGYYVTQWQPQAKFAFENIDDAAYFTLRWL
jgi:hypothetical protein